MFYWSHKDTHVVLSDDEELELVQKLGKDAEEIIRYHTSSDTRREIEKRIFNFLERSMNSDSEKFFRKYVFRSFYDEVAQKMFPVMLDAYGRLTKKATNLPRDVESTLDGMAEDFSFSDTCDVYRVALLERSKLPWRSPTVTGHISFPVQSIQKLTGTVDHFFVACQAVTIKFTTDFVRITVPELPESVAKELNHNWD
jgi:hypothetical protein